MGVMVVWTCPTCGTEKGDCESGHGSAPEKPRCNHADGPVVIRQGYDGRQFEMGVCLRCGGIVFVVDKETAA